MDVLSTKPPCPNLMPRPILLTDRTQLALGRNQYLTLRYNPVLSIPTGRNPFHNPHLVFLPADWKEDAFSTDLHKTMSWPRCAPGRRSAILDSVGYSQCSCFLSRLIGLQLCKWRRRVNFLQTILIGKPYSDFQQGYSRRIMGHFHWQNRFEVSKFIGEDFVFVNKWLRRLCSTIPAELRWSSTG